jgi:O-antigen/teichoic acid export membrane protein
MTVTFYLAFCVLPFMSFFRLREASLRALKHVVQSELLLSVTRPVLTGVVVIGLFFWVGEKLKAPQAMTANLIAVVCTAVIGTVFLHKLLPKAVFRAQPDFANKKWLKVSLPLLLIAGMHIILKRTDIVMLGALKGSQQAGIYSAASRVSNLVVFGLMVINAILAPMISELYHTGQKEQLQKIITHAARAVFVFTLVISAILIIFGKFVLSLFGLVFVEAYLPLLILLTGQIVNALVGSVGFIMTMTGHQNQAGAIVTVSAAINIALNALLIPLMGLAGAAISTIFTMFLWNISMLVYVWKKLSINSTVINTLKHTPDNIT